jgi:flagellar assembly factor FliW
MNIHAVTGRNSFMNQDLEVRPEDIIVFGKGLPGFENAREFVIFSRPEHAPFHCMACSNDPDLQFILINPLHFLAEYDPHIPPHELRELDVRDPKELLLYTVVTFAPELSDSTANLLGPIFINIRTRRGKQIVIDDERYSVRERILR